MTQLTPILLATAVCLWADKAKPLVFTPRAPVARVVLSGAEPRDGRRVLLVSVAKVRNPKLAAISFQVTARPAGAAKALPVGAFSLYPADQPGVFHLPVPAQTVLQGARFTVELRLEAAAGADVTVEVDRVEWTAAPAAAPATKK